MKLTAQQFNKYKNGRGVQLATAHLFGGKKRKKSHHISLAVARRRSLEKGNSVFSSTATLAFYPMVIPLEPVQRSHSLVKYEPFFLIVSKMLKRKRNTFTLTHDFGTEHPPTPQQQHPCATPCCPIAIKVQRSAAGTFIFEKYAENRAVDYFVNNLIKILSSLVTLRLSVHLLLYKLEKIKISQPRQQRIQEGTTPPPRRFLHPAAQLPSLPRVLRLNSSV